MSDLDNLRTYAAADNARVADFWRSLRLPLPDSRCPHNSPDLPNFQLTPAQCLLCQMPAASEVRS